MAIQTSYPHIDKVAGKPACLQRLPRIRVSQIAVDYLNHGWSADEIVLHYPHLRRAEVHAALAYYFDHQTEIDREIEEEQRLIQEARANAQPTPAESRLRKQGLLPPNEGGSSARPAS